MNQLITTAGQPATMSSREIAELVEARHNDVIATIERLFGKGLLRSSRKTRREETGGRPIEVYDLIERDTHMVVSGYSDEHRARIIDRWQELEEATTKVSLLPDFTNPAESARAWAMQYEEREKAQAALAIAAPKAEFVDKYVESTTGSMGLRQVCKLLGAKQNEFTNFLLDRKIMYRTGKGAPLTPSANHMHAGRFEVRAGNAEHGETSHAYVQSKFTAKGVEWIAGEWAKHNIRSSTE